MSLKIVADGNIPGLERHFGHLGELVPVDGRSLDAGKLQDADVLLVRSVTRVDSSLLSGSRVRFVGSATSGIDHIRSGELEELGIHWCHAPGSNANAVVEYVLSAIATSGDKLESVLDGGFVGIVGFGAIGRLLASRFEALGIDFRVCDPWLNQQTVARAGSLEEVLAGTVVTLHTSLTDEHPWPSRHLLGARELALVGEDALLINASRGPVVDNRALLQALEDGAGFEVVLDTWEGEPAIDTDLLARVQVGTPHIAGYSLDGKLRGTRMLARALADYLQLDVGADTGDGEGAEPLQVDGDARDARLLRTVLLASYDIRADDAALRQALAGHSTADTIGKLFDDLRRHYPERRELAGRRVVCPGWDEEQQDLVRGLGCIPVTTGEST